uniref:Putative polyol transporter 3-like protein n=1 Tax=Tanacetum cinerariifolium TaxID=118510 RepID=A0A699GQR7_TANCI|nr:putative polyol transporter 3-like protein [Tanacetum cinerariifolium]
MVRKFWNVYTHSKTTKLPRFWQEVFEAAYEHFTIDVAGSRDAAISEITGMSFVSVDVEPSSLNSEVGRPPSVLLAGGTMLSCEPSLLANEEGHELTKIPDIKDSKEDKDLLCFERADIEVPTKAATPEIVGPTRELCTELIMGSRSSSELMILIEIESKRRILPQLVHYECTILAVANHKTSSSERNGVNCRKRKMSGSDNVAKKFGYNSTYGTGGYGSYGGIGSYNGGGLYGNNMYNRGGYGGGLYGSGGGMYGGGMYNSSYGGMGGIADGATRAKLLCTRTMATTSKLDSTRKDKGKMIIAEPKITATLDLRPIHYNKTIEEVVYCQWTSKHVHTRQPMKYCCILMEKKKQMVKVVFKSERRHQNHK